MNGVLVLDKPSGWTSHDGVARVRGILGEPSVGHLGTLDPLATGVLPLVLGAATRLAQFTEFDKEYEAVCLLGRVTDSEDVSGGTLEERSAIGLDPDAVRRAFEDLVKVREQVPPMVSAVKQGGVKLYELARKGKVVERRPRPVNIASVEVLSTDLPRVRFRVTCSGGTYVRTLCRTAGEALGCGGCMESLVRTRVGSFLLRDAVSFDQDPASWPIRPVSELVAHLPVVPLRDEGLRSVCNGNRVESAGTADGWVRVVNAKGRLVAMAEVSDGTLHPRKVFGLEGI
jgi:tRNA pseudouridine55 synthase